MRIEFLLEKSDKSKKKSSDPSNYQMVLIIYCFVALYKGILHECLSNVL